MSKDLRIKENFSNVFVWFTALTVCMCFARNEYKIGFLVFLAVSAFMFIPKLEAKISKIVKLGIWQKFLIVFILSTVINYCYNPTSFQSQPTLTQEAKNELKVFHDVISVINEDSLKELNNLVGYIENDKYENSQMADFIKNAQYELKEEVEIPTNVGKNYLKLSKSIKENMTNLIEKQKIISVKSDEWNHSQDEDIIIDINKKIQKINKLRIKIKRDLSKLG